ncbi:FAD-dependent monooxygenase [Kineococcus sp. SYSU DK003]|uniref:FAD-dependent monooxygenase n=1 Tax=Kineococcus sp. SYSU DK003 TaxID=3383124 RepID=UPI003D7CE79D
MTEHRARTVDRDDHHRGPDHDVVVVGAGPTGLLVAGDLAHAGVRVLVLEQHAGPAPHSRAFAVHARSLELLDGRGLAAGLEAEGTALQAFTVLGRARLDLSSLPSRFAHVLVLAQGHVDRALERRARQEGADVQRGARVVDLRVDPAGVEVDVVPHDGVRDGVPDGGPRTVTARYLVGADGVHSTVRARLGLPFPGGAVVRSLVLADVRLTAPPQEAFSVRGAQDAFVVVAPFGDGWYRVNAFDRRRQVPDGTPVTLEEIREVLVRTHGTDLGLTQARWLSRYHSDERQVPTYAAGPVFLAGDAAHVHSPAGGLGLNTGLQDAADLSWRLAAVVLGRAQESLLEAYTVERHRVGRQVLRTSGSIVRVAVLTRPPWGTVRDALAPAALRLPPVARRIALRVSAIGTSYPRPRGAHPLVGRRAPERRLTGGRWLHGILDGSTFVLVTGRPGPAVEGLRRELSPDPGPDLLVRPDGYVAWAGAAGGTGWLEALAALGWRTTDVPSRPLLTTVRSG